MTNDRPNDDRLADRFGVDLDRRTFIAAGGTVGATMLAGCASEEPTSSDGDDPTDEETDDSWADGANFRLLISDRPADIDDFDSLEVSFDSARIFDGGAEESDDEKDDENNLNEGADGGEGGEGESEDGDADAESNDADEEGDADDGVERRRDFYWLDLEGATVDLTRVVGDRAVSVFEGGLSPGTYEKIELHVADVEGTVDAEEANVKVPSEKLQIVHAFEISEDEPLEFVFDINVVQKGNGLDYNLKPVISESGVAGEDVDVERADEDEDGDEGDDEPDGSDGAAGEADGDSSAADDDADEGGNGEAADDGDDESGSNP